MNWLKISNNWFLDVLEQKMWENVSKILNLNITWKTIVVGLFYECTDTTTIFNNVISFKGCKTYKYGIMSRLQSKTSNEIAFLSTLK